MFGITTKQLGGGGGGGGEGGEGGEGGDGAGDWQAVRQIFFSLLWERPVPWVLK